MWFTIVVANDPTVVKASYIHHRVVSVKFRNRERFVARSITYSFQIHGRHVKDNRTTYVLLTIAFILYL